MVHVFSFLEACNRMRGLAAAACMAALNERTTCAHDSLGLHGATAWPWEGPCEVAEVVRGPGWHERCFLSCEAHFE